MAFRQPTYQPPQRIYTVPTEPQTQSQSPTQQSQSLADEQEWILFSPLADSSTDRTYTASTARTRTAGRSRISDFGSLDTAARSYDEQLNGSEEGAIEDEEDGELDSLDSHLHEFRSEPSVYRRSAEASGTVLPTHDGLGSFRVDQPGGMGEDIQEHLYAFERYNPRRVKRRRESMELGALELDSECAADAERTRRIEKWRTEQSRILVDEIQRETRRRKQSMSSERRTLLHDHEQEDLATLSTVGTSDEVPDPEYESFWNRITRRVIRDLIGIDDELLSVIFGETLPEDDDLSSTPPANRTMESSNGLIPTAHYDRFSWEYTLLDRIARELGILVNQLSEHPGAFSNYLHSHEKPLPYAGLPVIPETARDHQPAMTDVQALPDTVATFPSSLAFAPTLQNQMQPIPIPQPSNSLATSPNENDVDATPRTSNPLSQPLMTHEEWERNLDIKMVFCYLRDRFTSKFRASGPPATMDPLEFTTHGTSHLATASTADSAARAARVRQHHPLVTRETRERERRRSIERRTWKASVPTSPIVKVRRGSSSCASERLAASGGMASGKLNSGSSRHYWDFGPGGSVGSSSLITSTGGMGSWGEV